MHSPSSGGEGSEVRELRNLFPRLGGWVMFALGDAWNVPSEGTSVVFFRLVSPAEGTSALAPARF